MTDHQDAAFVEYVVKQLVENKDAVKIERTVDEMGVLIQLTVDPADMGRVIGKEGRTAKALRTLLRVLGAKNNSRVNLKIMEPDGREVPMSDDNAAPVVSAPAEPTPIEPMPAMPVATEEATEIM